MNHKTVQLLQRISQWTL